MKLLTSTIGSHMHQMQRPDSDVDLRSVTVTPLIDMLDPFVEQKIRTHQEGNADDVTYELRTFLRLLGKGSPSVIDIVYSPLVVPENKLGMELLKNKRKFINTEDAIKNCLGYCRGMWHNAQKGERPIKSMRSAIFTTDVVLSHVYGYEYDPLKWENRRSVKEIAGNTHELAILHDLLAIGVYNLNTVSTYVNEFDMNVVKEFCVKAYQRA